MRRPLTLLTAATVALALTVVTPAVAAPVPGAEQQTARVGPPTLKRAWLAEILYPIQARARPSAGARSVGRLAGETEYSRSQQILLVVGVRGAWVGVALPKRPNGSKGWVPLVAVQLHRTPYRLRVRLASRTVEVLRSGRVQAVHRAAVGAPRTPTPTGLFAVADTAPTNGPLGPQILVLTAYSDVLTDFLGGDGVSGIHGWRDPRAFGRATSNGCIRVAPAAVEAISRVAGSGTPVEILER